MFGRYTFTRKTQGTQNIPALYELMCGRTFVWEGVGGESLRSVLPATASSTACFLASATSRSTFDRSDTTSSVALLSAAATARCSSATACRFTSFTASSGQTTLSVRSVVTFCSVSIALAVIEYFSGVDYEI